MTASGRPELTDLVRDLDDDLTFAVSLGSKELFHTNLLGWFIEHHPAVADALHHEWNSGQAPTQPRALREWHHLDLVLADSDSGGAPGRSRVVVENKMFALPDHEQLRRHGHEIDKLAGSPALVLLSLADPGWPDGRWEDGEGRAWQYYSYQRLGEVLQDIDLPADTDSYTVLTLQGWAGMIKKLARLSELVGQPGPDEPVLLPKPTRQLLGRLDAPVQKLRAHHIAARLRTRLGSPLPEPVALHADVTRGLGLVEAFVRVADNVEAGWQLQGDQWRTAVRVTRGHPLHGRGDELHAQRARLAHNSAWATFTDSPFATLPAGPNGTQADGIPRFGRYSPDFAYRYVKVPDITVQTAVDEGLRLIDAAMDQRNTARWKQP